MQGTIDSLLEQLTNRNASLRLTALQRVVSLTIDPTRKSEQQSILGTSEIFCALRSILASEHERDENINAAALAINNLAKDHSANQTYIGEKTDIIRILITRLSTAKTDTAIGSFAGGLMQLIRNHKLNTNKVGKTTIDGGASVFDVVAKILGDSEASPLSKANVLALFNNLLNLLEPDSQKVILTHSSLLKNACSLLKPEMTVSEASKIPDHVNEILVMLETLSSFDAALFVNIPILEILKALQYKDPKITKSTLFIMSKFIETQSVLANKVAQNPMAITTLALLLKDYDNNDTFMAALRALYILRTLANTPSIDITALSKNVILNKFVVEVLACNNMSVRIYACNILEQLAARDPEFSLTNAQMETTAHIISHLFSYRAAGPRDAESINTEHYSKITALALIIALASKQAAFLGNRFIHNIVVSVKSDNPVIIFQAVLAMEKLALEHIDNAALFLACPGFIANVTAVLDSDRGSEIKIPLIFALENIAGDNPAYQTAILSQIDIKHFLNIITSPDTSRLDSIRLLFLLLKGQVSTYLLIAANASIQKTLVETLSDSSPKNATLQKIVAHDVAALVKNKPEIQEILGKNPKIFEGLVLAIKNNANYHAQANALSALFELTKSHPDNQRRAGETAQLMDSIANLLTYEKPVVRANAMICFSSLSEYHANFDKLADITAICKELSQFIKSSAISDEDKYSLLTIMLNLTTYATEPAEAPRVAAITPVLSSGGQANTASMQINSQQPGP
ncbi:MAG: hypothetical protein K0R66_1665 [Gammaproteobacteria bacterium]|nr:hypothetical protein [Gammaproteobacteria bacterium]